MSTTDSGRQAEDRVAELLKSQKHKIVARNWRNRYAEIDIVAEKSGVVLFVEVKYRSSGAWGGGEAAINSDKLRRMSRAAEYWVAENRWPGEYELAAAVVDDDRIELVELYDV